ncbi:hypothetical protein BDV97DRAFT_394877 [Delphinella strobiligena]|nr:hypothetical protein BDV97DRAFT_394877 [Delphinella strobiligena]
MSRMLEDPRTSLVLSRQRTPAGLPVSRPHAVANSLEARDEEANYTYPDPRMALNAPLSPYFQSFSLSTTSYPPFLAMTGNGDVQIIDEDPPTQPPPVMHSSPELDPVPPLDTTTQISTEHETLNPQKVRCVRCRRLREADHFPILTRGPDKGQRAKTCEFCKASGSDYNKRRKEWRHAAVEEAIKGAEK